MHDRLAPEVHREGSENSPASPKVPALGLSFLIFGVILPVLTLCVELTTHWSAMDFFDPIPTWWHVLLIALVPMTNGLLWRRSRVEVRVPDRWLMLLTGMSMVISGVYSIAFLPMVPFAGIALLFAGIGLLPLAPLIAFFNTLRGGMRLARVASRKWLWPGVAAGTIAIGVPLAWDLGTGYLLDRAIDGTVEQRLGAIQTLRNFGREGYLLERCYGGGGRGFATPFAFRDRINPERTETAREIYFRVTGQAFETRPVPAGLFLTERGRWSPSFDANLGGTRVANKVSGLTLKSSQFDSRIDGAGLTSYTEWTAVFKNTSWEQREARAQIELPPGGVVSRVTLWIDGEPREAAFGGRAQVRAAYQEVAVIQRRDPILVTTNGADRVLMQCFPVPPNGKEMKIRLGITAPLRLIDFKTAGMTLPRFTETNFEPGWGLSHEWEMKADGHFEPKSVTLRQSFSDRELPTAKEVRLLLKGTASDSYADDPSDPQYVIRQSLVDGASVAPKRVVYVIDGSVAMALYRGRLAEIFHQGRIKPEAAWFAGDVVEAWDGALPIGMWITQRNFGGGRDNIPALEAAWDFASQVPNSAIVWIHGSQPVELKSVDSLLNRVERAAHRPVIYDLAVEPGPNRIAEKLGDAVTWRRWGRLSSPMGNVMDALGAATGSVKSFTTQRERVPRAEVTALMLSADRHLVRLWGREEVERLRKGSPEAAMKLAVQLQFVTPVSGAVVLERKEQYERHGLTPAELGTVPMIPEPGSVLLLASAVGCLATRRRRAQCASDR